jgi:hypothetical protein
MTNEQVQATITKYEEIVRFNAETTTTHDVIAEVIDPLNLYEVTLEVADTAHDLGIFVDDDDMAALRVAAEEFVSRLKTERTSA